MTKPQTRRWAVGASLALLAALTLLLLLPRASLRSGPTEGTAPPMVGSPAPASPASSEAPAVARGAAPDITPAGARQTASDPATAATPAPPPAQARRAKSLSDSVWIKGLVTDHQGSPVASARLSIWTWGVNPRELASAETDRAGRYELDLPAFDGGSLRVQKRGYAALEDDLRPRGAAELRRDYVLPEAAGSIRGRVTDQAGVPMDDVRVGLLFSETFSVAKSHRFMARETRSDSRGRFEFQELPAADIALQFLKKGFLLDGTSLTLSHGEDATVNFRMTKGNPVELLVTDPEGLPLNYAQLDCGFPLAAGSDAEGLAYIVFPPDRDGPFPCSLSAPGHLARDIELDPKTRRHREVLEPGPEFRGVVLTAEGRPVAEAKVVVSGKGHHFEGQVSTDRAGGFSIRLSRPPVATVTVSSPGFVEARVDLEGAAPDDLEIRLKRPEAGLYGTVVDSSGAPVRVFTIRLSDQNNRYSRHFNDSTGHFEIFDLPAGAYRIECTSPQPELAGLTAGTGPIEIPPNRTVGELLLRFPPP